MKIMRVIPCFRVIGLKQYGKEILLCIALGIIIPYSMFSLSEKTVERQNDDKSMSIVIAEQKAEAPKETINVLLANGSVNTMDLDEYLTGVVLQEIPANFEDETLKAQAVVARTYTLRRKRNGSKHGSADICTDADCCQGYCSAVDYLGKGGKLNNIERARSAVEQTENLVLVYDGDLIEATYFSCSGGMTEDAVAVWGSDIPYLKATESPGEEIASHYTDTIYMTVGDFSRALNAQLLGSPESWIDNITYTAGGGVDTLLVCGIEYKGTEIRKLLNLRSTAFTITILGDTVTITTKGFGHRVGMSQYGAEAMAISGKTYNEILCHYYQQTQLVSLESLSD